MKVTLTGGPADGRVVNAIGIKVLVHRPRPDGQMETYVYEWFEGMMVYAETVIQEPYALARAWENSPPPRDTTWRGRLLDICLRWRD